ncbi:MAG: aldolase [Promethearchaeati archaeon SRVP18_Atabeyarchaeia-1]
MKVEITSFLTKGRSMILAYDHGIEHGPRDFDERSVDPAFIMDIASKGSFNGIVFQKGIAEAYYDGRVPLIVKLNGKSELVEGEPVSRQICSVDEAVSLGAKAVGYTVYLGSAHESIMLQELGEIVEEAHLMDLPVMVWMYPRGGRVKIDTAKEIVAYAARAGLEIGADAAKIKYSGDVDSFRWAVKCAGKVKVFMSGGPKADTQKEFLKQVREVMDAGATGVAVGRNVWQDQDPLRMAKMLKSIVIDNSELEDALVVTD